VAIWQKGGRRPQANQMPVVNDTQEYGDRWNAWWWGMQPSWREPDSPFVIPSEASAGSWSHLLCGGPNGLLLVILALAWWMKYSTGTDTSLIEDAAIDVTWVLDQLSLALEVGNKGKKRELESEPGDDEHPSTKRYLFYCSSKLKAKINDI
jgi:hypothetical protein